MNTRICKPEFRSLLAGVLLFEKQARQAFNHLVAMGAVNFQPTKWYERRNAFSAIDMVYVDPGMWTAEITRDRLLMMMAREVRNDVVDWKVLAVERMNDV